MCLAVPGQIIARHERGETPMAQVDVRGVRSEACLAYVPEAQVGDWVLVHLGMALQCLDEQEALRQLSPALADLTPEVQAVLLHTARGASEHWLVPIDDCYRLVALIRREWRGLSGGSTVWPAIAGFFADLAEPRRSTS